MARLTLLLLFCIVSMPLFADPIDDSIEKGEYKEAEAALEKEIDKAPANQKGKLKSKLALVYYRDQEDEKAFKTYLDALALVKPLKPPVVSSEEQKLYDQALQSYLDQSANASPREAANKIRTEYSPILALHSDYYLLNFIVASAYANLGMFDEFFDRFYVSYQYYPDSYMAYKTKAILHLKLYEKASTLKDKEAQRVAIFDNAKLASEKYEKDASLYRIMINFSSEKEKPAVITAALKKIMGDNIIVPRKDILFYVKEALAIKQPQLAQQFIDKAKQWYEYSRMLDTAQEMIDQQNKQN